MATNGLRVAGGVAKKAVKKGGGGFSGAFRCFSWPSPSTQV
jgi:hypothetical protein